MSVTHDEVRRLAQLAELDVSEEALPLLRADVADSRVRRPDQRRAGGEGVKAVRAGADAVRFRPDAVKPWPLAFGPAELRPASETASSWCPSSGSSGRDA